MREITLKRDEFGDMCNQVLRQCGSFCFKAHGSSMYPFIRNGDVLTIKPLDPSELRTGDVILYSTADNRALAHRIVKKENQNDQLMLLMRGDSLMSGDGWIQSVCIMGHVESLKRSEKIILLNQGALNFLAKVWVKIHPIGPLSIKLASKLEQIISFLGRSL